MTAATGSAAVSLSAAGSTAARATGPGALTLAATGSTAARDTATGVFTFTGSGSAKASLNPPAAVFTFTAGGSSRAAAIGSLGLDMEGTADIQADEIIQASLDLEFIPSWNTQALAGAGVAALAFDAYATTGTALGLPAKGRATMLLTMTNGDAVHPAAAGRAHLEFGQISISTLFEGWGLVGI